MITFYQHKLYPCSSDRNMLYWCLLLQYIPQFSMNDAKKLILRLKTMLHSKHIYHISFNFAVGWSDCMTYSNGWMPLVRGNENKWKQKICYCFRTLIYISRLYDSHFRKRVIEGLDIGGFKELYFPIYVIDLMLFWRSCPKNRNVRKHSKHVQNVQRFKL